MVKYAVHTKWSWPDGVPSAESMQQRHREVKSKTKNYEHSVEVYDPLRKLVPPHGLEVKPFLRVRFAQPLSVLHTS